MVSLSKGILLEDENTLLEWGLPIHEIAKKLNKTGKDEGDRTIYYWGNHTILNGLELYLTNRYWNHGKENWFRNFHKIEFWAEGDKEAIEYFDKISTHLIKIYGEPKSKDESSPPEKSWEWEINNVNLTLYFFEQHAYKLHFAITNIHPKNNLLLLIKAFFARSKYGIKLMLL